MPRSKIARFILDIPVTDAIFIIWCCCAFALLARREFHEIETVQEAGQADRHEKGAQDSSAGRGVRPGVRDLPAVLPSQDDPYRGEEMAPDGEAVGGGLPSGVVP